MRTSIAVVTGALAAMASVAVAAPTTYSKPISRAEILARLNTSPVVAPEGLEKRFPGNVFLCTEDNFGGTCQVVNFSLAGPEGACTPLPSQFFHNLGSVGPDPGAICTLTAKTSTDGCNNQGDAIIAHPGQANLKALGIGAFAHHLQCKTCTGCT